MRNDRSGIECQPDSETVRATRLSEEAKTLSPGTVREAIEQRGDRAGRNERASE